MTERSSILNDDVLRGFLDEARAARLRQQEDSRTELPTAKQQGGGAVVGDMKQAPAVAPLAKEQSSPTVARPHRDILDIMQVRKYPRRYAMLGGAAVVGAIVLGAATVPGSTDSRIESMTFSGMDHLPDVAEVEVSLEQPLYYGIPKYTEDGKEVIMYYSDDKSITGKRTVQQEELANFKYPAKALADKDDEQELVNRLPAVYFDGSLDIDIVRRDGEDGIASHGKGIIVDRGAYAVGGLVNTLNPPRIGYEPVETNPDAVDGKTVREESIAALEATMDGDAEKKGRQANPRILEAAQYLAREVISSGDWGCSKAVYAAADQALVAAVDKAVEARIDGEFDERKIILDGSYVAPSRFYEEVKLNGDKDSVMKTDQYIVSLSDLYTKADVSCEVVAGDGARKEEG